MTVTARYLLRQIMEPLAAALVIGLMVLLAERMVRLLDLTLGKKNSLSVVFEMLAYLVPHYVGIALPAALFLGLLFGFNRLSKNSEIDAYLAAGIGLHQLTRPILMLAAVFMAMAILIFGFVQPHARYAYRAIVHTIKNIEVFYLAEEGVFMRAGPRTFILQHLSRRDNVFEHIFLFNDRGKAGTQTVTAQRGSLIDVPNRARPVLRLRAGHHLSIPVPVTTDGKQQPPRQTSNTFDLVDTPLGSEGPVLFPARGNAPRELSLPELFRYIQNPPTGKTPKKLRPDWIRAEFHYRLINIVTIPFLPLLAIPFALGRRRGQRPYRFGAALIILIIFFEAFEQGALAVRTRGYSPYLVLWIPYLTLVALSSWRYYRACFTMGSDGLEPVFDRVSEAVAWLKRFIPAFKGTA